MEEVKMVERYRMPTRILHWIHAGAFVILLITGLFVFFGGPAGSVPRVVHHIFAGIFVVIPIIYLIVHPVATVNSIMEAFFWGKDDIEWVKAAIPYYLLGQEEKMIPQEHMNTGQKLFWLFVIVFGVILAVTGGLMWFCKGSSPHIFRTSLFIHSLSTIIIGCFFLVHVYLSLLHPLMAGIFWSMVKGTVTTEYAKSHHGKWYKKIAGEETEE
jgi:formate dehydrogenase subunit gamma